MSRYVLRLRKHLEGVQLGSNSETLRRAIQKRLKMIKLIHIALQLLKPLDYPLTV